MNITSIPWSSGLRYSTQALLKRMFSPLCGLIEEIGFAQREPYGDKVITAGGHLTGVHVLLDLPDPGKGGYHLGGAGICENEAMIKTLGESVERYAQVMSGLANQNRYHYASYDAMQVEQKPVVAFEKLQYFTTAQLQADYFPFKALSKEDVLGWIPVKTLIADQTIWVPAQCLLVGYQLSGEQNEPWIYPSVTTGTASHVDPDKAFLNALLELIQLDSAMGHWYTRWKAYEIILDKRNAPLINLLKNVSATKIRQLKFYWIPNADLPSFTIACVYYQEGKTLPKVAIGLGSDVQLNQALYKAYLECIASVGLARLEIFKRIYETRDDAAIDPDNIFNLDTNVEYYATGHNFKRIVERFIAMDTIAASDLPADANAFELIQQVMEKCQQTEKELYFLDLTNTEARELGFVVPRVWSPDLLSLCLPSAAPMAHTRFKAYGGVSHVEPHPYP